MSDDGWGDNNAGEEGEAGQETGGGGAEGGCRRCGEVGQGLSKTSIPNHFFLYS